MAQVPAKLSPLQQYMVITGNYWGFTITDGALRMLVVLHFHTLGYSPFSIAMLFLFYEVFGVITNLVGGWLGARIGLNRTMNLGLFIQIGALAMLLVPSEYLTVVWVMIAQAFSGIAKDLNKMSAKSAIKTLVPKNASGALYRWVAILTGSKNALKGAGFFLGGILLGALGFKGAVLAMVVALSFIFLFSLVMLRTELGQSSFKPKFTEIFSKSGPVNTLSAARMFLFGSRDVWFVVALPVFFVTELNWHHGSVGTFFAIWIIGYGFLQSVTPTLTGLRSGKVPDGRTALYAAVPLAALPAVLGYALNFEIDLQTTLVSGLLLYGFFFAINSSVHSFLIVDYAKSDGVSLDVGFYYMANAMGRLIGTVLSGWIYQQYGLAACLYISSAFIILTLLISFKLPSASVTAKTHGQ